MIFNFNSRYPTALELEDLPSLLNLKAKTAEVLAAWKHRDETLGDDYPSINDFYRGRHVFVTGGTGFCGKVIVEKLLQGCPDIGNVYLLIRPGRPDRGGQTPADRLQEMIRLPVFDRLRKENPAALLKLVAVGGDCMKEGLGLSAEDRRLLIDQVSVIIHSAASVRFNDPIMKAARMNTCSTADIVQLAREMRGLKALVHISTAYCNTAHNPTMEKTYPTEHDYKDVLKYINLPDAEVLDVLGHKFMGYQPNSYVFTKALSEQVVKEAAKDLPIVIVRPSIVTCALDEPVPGWMDNLNGFAVFWAVTAKGVMRVSYSPNSDTRFDLVPVDTVAKAVILASWATGTDQLPVTPDDVPVIHSVAGDVKASTKFMMLNTMQKHLDDKTVAYPNVVRYPKNVVFNNYPVYYVCMLLYHVLFGAIIDTVLVAFKQKPQLLPVYRKIEAANQALQYFQYNEFKFDTNLAYRMIGLQHPRDRRVFNFYDEDMNLPNWYDISRDQLLGVCKYALKEPIRGKEDLEKNSRVINMLWWAEACWYFFLAAVSLWFVYCRVIA